MKFPILKAFVFCLCGLALNTVAEPKQKDFHLSDLNNFQVNGEFLLSASLPNDAQLAVLAEAGVRHVVDLIPGNRTDEKQTVESLNMRYINIPVDWNNPTLEDFERYKSVLDEAMKNNEMVFTHCKLNWRGSAFTYLYRVTQMKEDEAVARADLDAIWKPNETWREFIANVKASY